MELLENYTILILPVGVLLYDDRVVRDVVAQRSGAGYARKLEGCENNRSYERNLQSKHAEMAKGCPFLLKHRWLFDQTTPGVAIASTKCSVRH